MAALNETQCKIASEESRNNRRLRSDLEYRIWGKFAKLDLARPQLTSEAALHKHADGYGNAGFDVRLAGGGPTLPQNSLLTGWTFVLL
ncbi:MAG: hypothetical protein WAM39_05265 [Bryobacteraceae bacterium]